MFCLLWSVSVYVYKLVWSNLQTIFSEFNLKLKIYQKTETNILCKL